MSSTPERVCAGCGDTDEMARLESCPICAKPFCPDCAHRALGRRFCSAECAKAYYFYGELDDDENSGIDDDDDE